MATVSAGSPGTVSRWPTSTPGCSLSDEDLPTVCAGEAQGAAEVIHDAPPLTSNLLDDFFEEVC